MDAICQQCPLRLATGHEPGHSLLEGITMQPSSLKVIAACLWLVAASASAQQSAGIAGYPNKPVRVIIPVAPGGGTDLIARIVMTKLSAGVGIWMRQGRKNDRGIPR